MLLSGILRPNDGGWQLETGRALPKAVVTAVKIVGGYETTDIFRTSDIEDIAK